MFHLSITTASSSLTRTYQPSFALCYLSNRLVLTLAGSSPPGLKFFKPAFNHYQTFLMHTRNSSRKRSVSPSVSALGINGLDQESSGVDAGISTFKKRILAPSSSKSQTSGKVALAQSSIKTEEDDQFAEPLATKNSLVWFRTSDLRLSDNRALYAASLRSKVSSDPEHRFLIALFIIHEDEWLSHDDAPVKIDFWMRNLEELRKGLEKMAIPLVVRQLSSVTNLGSGSPINQNKEAERDMRKQRERRVVQIVKDTVKEMNISHVFWNRELMVDESHRDNAVREALENNPECRAIVEEFDDQCIVPPPEVRTKTGNVYTVFTPFFNNWCKVVEANPHHLDLDPPPDHNPAEARQIFSHFLTPSSPLFVPTYPHGFERDTIEQLYPAGEQAAKLRLDEFLESRAKDYHRDRDCVEKANACSGMSPYLNAGVVSARQVIAAARKCNHGKMTTGNEGIKNWIKEVAWREFYRHILVNFPRICMNRAFQLKTELIQWADAKSDPNPELPQSMSHFESWCTGKTGFPIVDAGIRQLLDTATMHNRLRMIVACFLVKDLLINWQEGEKFFMKHLIDGDLASNNGGWQWSASTGTDAQPFFRVFNPTLQAQKFDPYGEFIRRWVPELRSLKNPKQVHEPYKTLSKVEFEKLGYPKPIVDHAAAKERYIKEFKRAVRIN